MPKRRKNVVESNAVNKDHTGSEALSLEEAKGLFLRDIRGLAEQTRRWHKENLNALIRVLKMQGIVITDVNMLSHKLLKEKFVFYMLEEMELKTNTINGRIRSVRALSKFLCREGHVRNDFGMGMELIKGSKVIIETFTEDHLSVLFHQPDRRTFTGLRDYTMMLLLIETGIRISECMTIRLSDIRLKDGVILINGKGSKQRFVPFQSTFRKVLSAYLDARGSAETDALFVTVEGTQMSKRYAQELIQMYGERAGISGVSCSPHTFRHTMAKYYILQGGDIFSLQKLLGHSSMETVRLYVELFSNDVQQQHRKFSYLENRFTERH